jgi:GT2 family glycosyltransferase
MQNHHRLECGLAAQIAGGTQEAAFLHSIPWVIDAHPQHPDSLVSVLQRESRRLGQLARQCRFSILAVLRDSWPQHLNELILSVRCQSYANWELLLVDGGTTPRAHREVARRWAEREERIRLVEFGSALGSHRARNAAVSRATGDYLVFVDDDGVLHPMALGVFARHFNDDPRVNFAFSNEAQIDHASSGLTNFILKPLLDRFTLLRVPYIGRLYAVRRDLLERAAREESVFRHEYDGIEEHDLWLRLALADGVESRHVPLFMYYRRAGSHGLARLTDHELAVRRRRLAEEFIPQIYPGAAWSLDVPSDRDPLAATRIWLTGLPGYECKKVLIVIPFKDQVETTIKCLESIERQEHQLDTLVALVNNQSVEATTLPRLHWWIDAHRRSRYEILNLDYSFNFARLNNEAVGRLSGDRDLIFLLNNDVELTMPQTLETLALQLLADPSIGFVGIKLYYPGGQEVQHGGIRVGELIYGSGYNEIKHDRSAADFVDADRITLGVTFACAMARRETFERLGGLDEVFLPNGYGDVDMCLRALGAGFRNYCLGSLSGIHHESKTRGFTNEDLEFSLLHQRNGTIIATWRHWRLNRSHRHAWPLAVDRLNDPRLALQHESTRSTLRSSPAISEAPISSPLRYRLADRINQVLKRALGPLHGILRSGLLVAARSFRAAQQPRAIVALGRRVSGLSPALAALARRIRPHARKLVHRWRVSVGLAKALYRDPGALELLVTGCARAGTRGLRQSIRILVPGIPSAYQSHQQWFDATRPSPQLLARFRRRTWPAHAPRFTVVTPVYNVREDWLRAAVGSVIAQTYPHWQMICVNDQSTALHVAPVLDELAASDTRVKVIHCPANRGVSAATNRGINEATGDYIAFMDHDDYLEPHALHRLAEAVLQERPDMIYTDEAVTDVDLNHIRHVACRPSFSYDYYLSSPYYVHLVAARADLVRRIGGLNEQMTISQDIDFGLRLIESCHEITHVAEVLYRWRTHPGSLGHREQHNVLTMTRGAFERHFERIGVAVHFDDKPNFNFRDIRFDPPTPAEVAIVIPTRDNVVGLRRCVAGLELTTPQDGAQIVILDQSADQPAEGAALKELGRRHQVLRFDRAHSSSAVRNRGAAAAQPATHFLFLSDGLETLAPGWLEHMLGYAGRDDVGIVGATLLNPDGTVEHTGVVMGLNGTHDHALRDAHFRVPDLGRCAGPNGMLLSSRDVSAVSTSCMLVRAELFDRLGGFDDSLDDRYCGLDLCLRARALGYKVILDAYAVLRHQAMDSRGAGREVPRWSDLRPFLKRHAARFFAGDPFYSPLMSMTATDTSFAPARGTPERVRSRTGPVVLPSRTSGSKLFRVDSGSRSQPIGHDARMAASADQDTGAYTACRR